MRRGAVLRHASAGALVLAAEVYTYRRYALFGAQFHFWLHLLLGLAIAFGVLAAWRLARPRAARRAGPFESGFAGHLYAALPDVLFTAAGVLHARWMDVLGLHITAHFLWPSPLGAGLLLVLLTLTAYVAVTLRWRRAAGTTLLLAAGFLALAGLLRAPLPTTLQQVRNAGAHPAAAHGWLWVCGVDTGGSTGWFSATVHANR